MNELALFAGAGGGILGARLLGWRTVCAVEIDPYCREVLLRRQEEGFLPPFPIWDDVRSFNGRPWRGKVDVVTAGFPCQPFSLVGAKQQSDDTRNLWPETRDVLNEVRAPHAVLENVPGLLALRGPRGQLPYFGNILRDLAELGYFAAPWDCLSACMFGAPHPRARLFVCPDAYGIGLQGRRTTGAQPTSGPWSPEQFEGLVQSELRTAVPAGAHGRVSDRVAFRVDRLRALGNGQVPAVARAAWELLSGL